MKYLIINADDFGLTPGVNRGICQSHRHGILTSTSLMANLPAFEDAVTLARANPNLGVGVHFNLTEGRPISPAGQVTTLLNGNGGFISDYQVVLKKLFSRRLNLAEVERELRAQLQKIRQAQLQPTHIDSHKHLHIFPGIIEVVIRLALEYNIKKIRLPLESTSFIKKSLLPSGWNSKVAIKQYANMKIIAFFSRRAAEKFKQNGIKTNDNFFGILYTGFLNTRVLAEAINRLTPGCWEIMTHPGCWDAELNTMHTRLFQQREAEMQALQAPELRNALAEKEIKLINYAQLD
jgi:hopanoid biosynthesis associated protein HpnK